MQMKQTLMTKWSLLSKRLDLMESLYFRYKSELMEMIN